MHSEQRAPTQSRCGLKAVHLMPTTHCLPGQTGEDQGLRTTEPKRSTPGHAVRLGRWFVLGCATSQRPPEPQGAHNEGFREQWDLLQCATCRRSALPSSPQGQKTISQQPIGCEAVAASSSGRALPGTLGLSFEAGLLARSPARPLPGFPVGFCGVRCVRNLQLRVQLRYCTGFPFQHAG